MPAAPAQRFISARLAEVQYATQRLTETAALFQAMGSPAQAPAQEPAQEPARGRRPAAQRLNQTPDTFLVSWPPSLARGFFSR